MLTTKSPGGTGVRWPSACSVSPAALSVADQSRMIAWGGDYFRSGDTLINLERRLRPPSLFGELLRLLTPGGQFTFVGAVCLRVTGEADRQVTIAGYAR